MNIDENSTHTLTHTHPHPPSPTPTLTNTPTPTLTNTPSPTLTNTPTHTPEDATNLNYGTHRRHITTMYALTTIMDTAKRVVPPIPFVY